MADALIIKSSGDFQLKSGASISVKDNGPAYILPGLEQSHWLASNATVTGGKVMSIADESGVQALTPWPQPAYPSPVAFPYQYEASGWTNNGKTLPTWTFDQISFGVTLPLYEANAWATKLSNYTGAFTVAMLVKSVVNLNGSNASYTPFFSSSKDDYSNGWQNQVFSVNETPYGSVGWMMDRRTPNYGLQWTSTYYPGQPVTAWEGYKLVMVEFMGTAISTAQVSSKIWVNGTAQTTIPNQSSGTGQATTFGKFFVGGSRLSNSVAGVANGTKFAQFHIWKGSLTDTQRNDVTAYLKSISGIA